MLNISKMPVAPEEFETEVLDELTEDNLRMSLMSVAERRFVNGLVRYFRPKRLIELGTFAGGGTCILLNAIKDVDGAKLTSIDILLEIPQGHSYIKKLLGTGNALPIGFSVKEKYPEGNKQWSLIAGKDPSEVIEDLAKDEKFDFVVLDTAHIHPVESLNFLSVLPFLSENAVVVLHDIAIYANHLPESNSVFRMHLACKLLFDTVVADKIILANDYYHAGGNPLSNIGAFQLNADTRKYIGNVFSMLKFPWGLFTDRIDSMSAIIKKHYEQKHIDVFEDALFANNVLRGNGCKSYSMKFHELQREIYSVTHYNGGKVIFYGAGDFAKQNIAWIKSLGLLPDVFWDSKAEEIGSLDDVPVVKPDFASLCFESKDLIIITIDKLAHPTAVAEIFLKIYQTGFSNAHHMNEFRLP